jgi:transposase-like protein
MTKSAKTKQIENMRAQLRYIEQEREELPEVLLEIAKGILRRKDKQQEEVNQAVLMMTTAR